MPGVAMKLSAIVEAAYRKIGVVGHGMDATAEQIAAGAQAFNLMIQGWRLEGIDFWLAPDVDPLARLDDYALTEEAPVPSAFLEGTIYSLAARLAPEYSMQVQFDEDAFKRRMQAALIKVPTVEIDRTLQRGAVYPRWVI
jgi:hypothetical protein